MKAGGMIFSFLNREDGASARLRSVQTHPRPNVVEDGVQVFLRFGFLVCTLFDVHSKIFQSRFNRIIRLMGRGLDKIEIS